MNRLPVPVRRPRAHFFRFLPEKKAGSIRRLLQPRNGLLMLSAVLLVLFALQAVRSLRTADRNRTYSLWHEAAEKAAPASASGNAVRTVQRMTLPDGSPITRELKQAQGLSVSEQVQTAVYHRTEGAFLPAMSALLEKNGDLVAWLSIRGLVDLPVVYRDNEWYLNHDFENRSNPAGTLFLDQDHPLEARTQNLLIHGHNMKDGSMFGLLIRYLDKDFWKSHSLLSLTTLWEKEEYLIFAVMVVPDDPRKDGYINYFSHPTFASDESFRSYLREVQARSRLPESLTVRPDDALLTLSTCIGEDHLVILARKN